MIDNDDIAKINERNECKKYIWQSASIFFFGKIFQVAVSLIFFEYLWKSTKIILIIIKIDQSLCIANSYIWSIYRLIFNDKGKDFRFFLFTYLFLSHVVQLCICKVLFYFLQFDLSSYLGLLLLLFFSIFDVADLYINKCCLKLFRIIKILLKEFLAFFK